jgi:ribose/xylose/arabinose/galactoside ABC-type transport system permease subunit
MNIGRGAWSVRRLGLWMVLVVVSAVFFVATDNFGTTLNLQNVLQQNAIIGIVACGMAMMMIVGGFDLSVGFTVTSAGMLTVGLFGAGHGAVVAISAGLFLGLAVGLANGFLISKVGINPFVTTFAMASVVRGILLISTHDGQPVTGAPGTLRKVAQGTLFRFNLAAGQRFGVPAIFVVYLVVLSTVWFLLTRTRLGHYFYSVGGNAEASHLSGVPVQRVQLIAFGLGGFLASFAGLLLVGLVNTGEPNSGIEYPLNSIAICVVGGIALTGGVGRILDVFAATLLLGVISNGLNHLNVSPSWQYLVTGGVILVSVVLDQYARRNGSAAPKSDRPRQSAIGATITSPLPVPGALDNTDAQYQSRPTLTDTSPTKGKQ